MAPTKTATETLRTLPTDEIRQVMWRMADLYGHQILVQLGLIRAYHPGRLTEDELDAFVRRLLFDTTEQAR